MSNPSSLTGSMLTNVAGIDILWESDYEGDIIELRRVFKYHLSNYDSTPHKNIHTVTIQTSDTPPTIPSDKVVQWEGHYMGLASGDNTMTWYHSPASHLDYILLTQGCFIIHDKKNARTICYAKPIDNTDSSKSRIEVENTIVVLIHTIASMYNRYTVHGAAVKYNGHAHVFMGESGSGKSTLCADLLRQGADFMGDDLVFFYIEDGKVMIGSLLFDAKLTVEHKPTGVKHIIPTILRKKKIRKRHIDIIKELDAGYTLSAPAKSMSLIQQIIPHDGQESYLEKQEPIDAVIHLFRASNSPLMQYDPDQWQNVFQTAAETLPYNILHFGDRKLLDIKFLDSTQ